MGDRKGERKRERKGERENGTRGHLARCAPKSLIYFNEN